MDALLTNVHDAREVQVAHPLHVLADGFERGVGESAVRLVLAKYGNKYTHLMHVQRSSEVRRVSEGAMETRPWSVRA